MEVKKALEESKGDEAKAIEILRKRGQEKAMKKSARSAKEGVIASYVHSNRKVAAMVEILCETDFVALNKDFQNLAQDIAMHITALNPKYLNPEDVPEEIIAKEKEIWTEQLKNEGKNEQMIPKILLGKEKKFREESALLTQPFVKNPDQTIADLITENINKIGENIQIGKFCRFEL